MKRVSTLLVVTLILMSLMVTSVGASNTPVTRIAGSDATGTSVEVSREGWASATTVVISRHDDFPDALAGTVLAHKEGGPILLTRPDSLSSRVGEEIQRLGAQRAILLGGEAALSPSLEGELKDLGLETDRIGGKNRYETAALIAREVGLQDKAVVVSGENFPDALAMGSYAAQNQIPLLLTREKDIPTVTREALEGVQETIVVGGKGVVSSFVKDQLPGPIRVAGEDRCATSVQILKELEMPADKLYLATGLGFADALVGSLLAARQGAPLLLVRGDIVPSSVEELIREKAPGEVVIIGEARVEKALEELLAQVIKEPEERVTPSYHAFMEGYREKDMFIMDAAQVLEMVEEERAVILDVRSDSWRAQSYISDSIHIPLPQLLDRLQELPQDKALALYCVKNINAAYGVTILNMLGYEAYLLEDGMEAWGEAGGSTTICPR